MAFVLRCSRCRGCHRMGQDVPLPRCWGWLGVPPPGTKLLLALQTAQSSVSCPSPFNEQRRVLCSRRTLCGESESQVRGQFIQVCCVARAHDLEGGFRGRLSPVWSKSALYRIFYKTCKITIKYNSLMAKAIRFYNYCYICFLTV